MATAATEEPLYTRTVRTEVIEPGAPRFRRRRRSSMGRFRLRARSAFRYTSTAVKTGYRKSRNFIVRNTKKSGNWIKRAAKWASSKVKAVASYAATKAKAGTAWVGHAARRAWRWSAAVLPTAVRRVIAWPVRVVSSVFTIGWLGALVIVAGLFVGGLWLIDHYDDSVNTRLEAATHKAYRPGQVKREHRAAKETRREPMMETVVVQGDDEKIVYEGVIVEGGEVNEPSREPLTPEFIQQETRAATPGGLGNPPIAPVVRPFSLENHFFVGEDGTMLDLLTDHNQSLPQFHALNDTSLQEAAANEIMEYLLEQNQSNDELSFWYGKLIANQRFSDAPDRFLHEDVKIWSKTLSDEFIDARNHGDSLIHWFRSRPFRSSYEEEARVITAKFAPQRAEV